MSVEHLCRQDLATLSFSRCILIVDVILVVVLFFCGSRVSRDPVFLKFHRRPMIFKSLAFQVQVEGSGCRGQGSEARLVCPEGLNDLRALISRGL